MRKIRRLLLLLHSNPSFRERVQQATRRGYRLQEIEGWDALRQMARDAPPSALVVVDPYAGMNGGNGPSEELFSFLQHFPSLTVLAAMEMKADRLDDACKMGRWGIVKVISLDHHDTPTALRVQFRTVRGRRFQHVVQHALPPNTPGPPRAILNTAAEIAVVGGYARDLAQLLHLSRATLLRWCKRAGLPPPRQTLVWMRILMAAELLDDPGRTVLDAAQACGYSSDSGLRRVMRRFVGQSPNRLRREGAFARASEAFLRAVGRPEWEEAPELRPALQSDRIDCRLDEP